MGGAVTHVELSLTESNQPAHMIGSVALDDPLSRWALAVSEATEACVLLNSNGVVVAASPACSSYFVVDPAEAIGKRLVDGVIRPIDFTATPDDLPEWEVEKIPPLLALTSGALARGLMRVPGEVGQQCSGANCTLDAIATPIRDATDGIAGSLTFFQCCGQ
jgi:hypothetical protein